VEVALVVVAKQVVAVVVAAQEDTAVLFLAKTLEVDFLPKLLLRRKKQQTTL
jgi:hypothetical protein